MCKFHDFSTTQILREITLGGSRSAKSAILAHSEALNSDFCEFLHFLKAEIYHLTKFIALKWQMMAVLQLLQSQKLVSY